MKSESSRRLIDWPNALRWLRPSERTTLLTLALVLGLASGIAIWLFQGGITFFHTLFQDLIAGQLLGPVLGPFGIIVALGLAGATVGLMMDRWIGRERHPGVAGIIESVALSGGRLRYWRAPIKALASALSLGAGASLGAEAPSVQIGANLGSAFGQRLHLSEDRIRLLVAAGAASAIAAAFRAPIAGVFFALEVILNGDFTVASFGVVVLSSVIASVFTGAITGGGPEFGVLNYQLGGPAEVPFYALLGLLLAPAAVLFMRSVIWQEDLWHRYAGGLPRPLRTALAGVMMGAIGLFLPELLGTGREVMKVVLSASIHDYGVLLLLALGLVKIAATALSLGGGFVGGIFAPSLFVGTMLGGAFGRLLEQFAPASAVGDAQSYAIAGMAAMLGGVVRAPITAILLVFELTNDYHLILPIMLTTVICVFLTERFEPYGLDILELVRKGIRLQQGRDVDVMQSITVGEAMRSPAPCINEDAPLLTLRDRLREEQTRSLCVVDEARRLIGIVTLTDLQRAYESGRNHLTVGDICVRDVITTAPDEPLWTAIRSMGARDVGRLPVLDAGSGSPLGIVSRQDIMRAYNIAIARKQQDHHAAQQSRLNTLTGAHVIERTLSPGSPAAGRRVNALEWPPNCVIASIRRGRRLIVPSGDTNLEVGDMLTFVTDPEVEPRLDELLAAPTGPGMNPRGHRAD